MLSKNNVLSLDLVSFVIVLRMGQAQSESGSDENLSLNPIFCKEWGSLGTRRNRFDARPAKQSAY
jgi:hypothetical protein